MHKILVFVVFFLTAASALRSVTKSCSAVINVPDTSYEKMWNLAREQLGLKPMIFLSRHATIVYSFYHFSNGVGVYNISGRPVTYAKVWKAGNEAIRSNLFVQERKELPREKRGFIAHEHLKMPEYHARLKEFHGSNSEIFTFVRDPMDHFEAGLAEYYFRCFPKKRVYVSEIKEIIIDMLNGNALSPLFDKCSSSSRYSVKHVFPMTGVIASGWKIKYIGKLENFDEDWAALNDIYKMNITFNHKMGLHKTSNDPNGVRKAFREMITDPENVAYTRALCRLLQVDYTCFDYQLPDPCRNAGGI